MPRFVIGVRAGHLFQQGQIVDSERIHFPFAAAPRSTNEQR
jgi:hypothetical protein